MLTFKAALLTLLLIASSVTAQQMTAPAPPSAEVQALIANDPALLTILNNHFGCAQWEGTNCLKCSVNYYFNTKGICCKVDPQCKLFNQDVGICEQCYQGYALNNGTCLLVAPGSHPNPGCQQFDGANNCILCSVRFAPDANGVCIPVSDNCRTWDEATGACLTCYSGYVLSQAACVRDPNPFIPASNSLCKTFDAAQACLACADRAFLNANGVCAPISDNCNTWDAMTGSCLTCYIGFQLVNGQCNLAPEINPSDLGCKNWDWNNQVCLACSKNWVFNANNVCVPVSDQCATSDAAGACLTCFFGYDLQAGSCIVSASNTARPSDLGCATWDWNNNACLSCAEWFVFDSNQACVAVSDLCQQYDFVTGECTACFQGFTLNQGVCAPSQPISPADIGCGAWDWNNQVCLSCSQNWVLISGACVSVSDQCATFDSASGNCLTCYQGYNLQGGQCIIQDLTLVVPSDKGCADWNWNSNICLACSKNWFFNAEGVCVPVSDLCRTADPNGNCLTCYNGYDLVNGVCEFSASNTAAPSDAGCATWDWNNQVCLACSKNWVFNANNVCVPVSDQCASHDASGACTACFKGYDLVNGVCEFSASNTAAPSDAGCATWDWNNQVCLACSKNWVFNANNVCVPVSDQCASHDASGACTACFKGYDLVNGVCEFSASNTAAPSDAGCATWDWNNQVCLACSKNWIFNANNVCVPVSDQCASHDASGACTACFKGYDLVNGVCEFSASNTAAPSDAGCATWDWNNQVCLACSKNWVFNANNVCVPVSDQCASHDASGACTACFKGYDLVNGVCEFSASNTAAPSDAGCATWDWNNQVCLACSKNWVFNANNVCVPVSDQCASHDASGACTACFKGYDLVNGVCEFSASNTAAPSDAGCATWDWNNQVCLACSKNWVFNANNVCVPVSDQCASHDASGACTACFKGYDLVNGVCEFSASNTAAPSDAGCATWDWNNQVCLACSKNWVFNANNVCVPVSDQCASHDASGACTACFKGYDLVNGVCEFSASNTAAPSDAGCATWDWNNQVCLACSKNWVFNANNVCVPVSDQCASHDASGACTACFKGYDLVNGVCEFSASNTAAPSDAGCATWDWNNQVCLACSKNWVFNANNVCVPVSDQCASHDASGACTACFKGYDLVNGVCEFSASNTAAPSDAGCATWDWNNQVCLACSKNWVFNANNVCVPVSDQCASHDASGACTACFKGYDLVNGVCEFSASNTAAPSDAGCATWDWNNQVCLACSKNWVFNANNVCVPVSDQCASHDASGACTACFKGYDLVNGVCEFSASNTAAPSDAGCATWDWNNQVCLACSKNWVFNANNVCVPVSDQCASHDASGACTACFKGYDLVNGVCEFSASNTAAPSDAGCATWDWNNQVCLACSKNWVFNANNVCVPVSDQCASHDASGACTACFKGYDLVNGVCEFSTFNNAKPSDPGCGTWDWNNQVCLACSKNWVFNANKVCTPVDDMCSAYEQGTGLCTACFSGFLLSSGSCVLANPLCKASTSTGSCSSCYTGYVLASGTCTPISQLASLFLYYSECCPEKLAQLQAAAAQP